MWKLILKIAVKETRRITNYNDSSTCIIKLTDDKSRQQAMSSHHFESNKTENIFHLLACYQHPSSQIVIWLKSHRLLLRVSTSAFCYFLLICNNLGRDNMHNILY